MLPSFSAFFWPFIRFFGYVFWQFWTLFWDKKDLLNPVKNVQKKFQLKIPTLSKNDCSATWKPNTNQKNFTQDQLRNVQRYQKYVPIFRAFFLTVSDQFKPTVWNDTFYSECNLPTYVQWCHYEMQQSPLYVLNSQLDNIILPS